MRLVLSAEQCTSKIDAQHFAVPSTARSVCCPLLSSPAMSTLAFCLVRHFKSCNFIWETEGKSFTSVSDVTNRWLYDCEYLLMRQLSWDTATTSCTFTTSPSTAWHIVNCPAEQGPYSKPAILVPAVVWIVSYSITRHQNAAEYTKSHI